MFNCKEKQLLVNTARRYGKSLEHIRLGASLERISACLEISEALEFTASIIRQGSNQLDRLGLNQGPISQRINLTHRIDSLKSSLSTVINVDFQQAKKTISNLASPKEIANAGLLKSYTKKLVKVMSCGWLGCWGSCLACAGRCRGCGLRPSSLEWWVSEQMRDEYGLRLSEAVAGSELGG